MLWLVFIPRDISNEINIAVQYELPREIRLDENSISAFSLFFPFTALKEENIKSDMEKYSAEIDYLISCYFLLLYLNRRLCTHF